jgi:hypothetical protein
MTTLHQAERLARRIGEVVGHPAPDAQAARLAQDYAELCRTANRRLEQCALMIEAGQSLPALQLAETPPPLLDLITVLSFRQASDWRAYCQTHNLAWAEPFYDKYVRLLNSTYGKGIAGDHPFYRDYRRAVMKNDDDRALSILRVIARLNPSDENTKEELKRLEEKLARVKVEALSGALEKGDVAAAAAQVARIESSGLPIPSSHPVWQRLQVARCRELLAKAGTLRENGAWEEAEGIVDKIHALATQNNLQLPAADADLWNSLEEWTGGRRGAYAREQDFKRAVSALEYEVQSIENMRSAGSRLSVAQTQSALESLTAKSRLTEGFGLPLDSELAEQCKDCAAWLQSRLKSAEKKQRARALVITLLILAAVGAAVPAALDWSRQREYLASLNSLQSGRRVADTRAVVRRIPAKLKTRPMMADGLSKAKQFISRELALKEGFDQKLADLKESRDAGGSLEETGARRAECDQAIATLAPEFQPQARSALATWDSKWAAVRNGELSSRLARAEQVAAGLSAAGGFEAARTAISQLKSELAGMNVLLAQPPPVEAALDANYRELAAKADHWSELIQDWETTQASLQEASGLEEYLTTLVHLADSPFAAAAQRDAVAEISRLRINETTLLGELLLPDDKDAWDSLTNTASWRTAYMPGQPSAQEKEAFLKLRDDKNMQDIYAYQLVTNSRPGNPFQTHPVFAQGLITLDRAGQNSGLVYDPAERRNAPHFSQQTYSDWDYIKIIKLFRTQECDAYDRLGLGEWIDSNTGNFQKPVLQLFDQLNQDDNSSAIFRAFVTIKLYELARMRPLDWGLQWAPDAARNIRRLEELGAGDLQSGDWMVRGQAAKYEKELRMFFAEARTVPLWNEAQFHCELARQTCEQGFLFAGFVGLDGAPILRRIVIPRAEYWGWDARSASASLLFRRASDGAALEKLGEPMPCTPLLVFPGDRRKILLDAQPAAGAAASAASAASVLPPFFSGL